MFKEVIVMASLKKPGCILLMIIILIVVAATDTVYAYAEELASCEIPVTCRISPDIPLDLDLDFRYTLKAGNEECPMPEGSHDGEKTVHMTDSGKVEFGRIVFDHPDVFRYTLKETTDEAGAFRRDSTEYQAALIADADGKVRMVVNTDRGSKPDKIEFVNSYKRNDKPQDGEAPRVPRTGDASDIRTALLLFVIEIAVLAATACSRHTGKVLTDQRGLLRTEEILMKRAHAAPGKKYRHISAFLICAVLTALILGFQWSCEGQAYAEVRTVSDYSELPVNKVEISELMLDDAVFTSLDPSIKMVDMGYYSSNQSIKLPSICWVSSTKPKFGSSDATATQNANLGNNTVAGELFTLRFKNAAKLSDGAEKDVLMIFSDLYFGLSKNINNTTGSKYYYPIISVTEDGRIDYCNTGIGINTSDSGRIKGIRSATRIRTTIRIVEPDTDEAVGDMSYILGFRDLDIKDRTAATGDDIDSFACKYSEGIGLISGYTEPVYLSEDTLIRQDTWDGVTKLRGIHLDNGGIASGFDVAVSAAEFTYYWYGSYNVGSNASHPGGSMGTVFGYSPKVSVFASAGAGGSIEKPGAAEYIVNSSTSYSYQPADGYKVRKLTVDGEQVPFNRDGGVYIFDKLTETDENSYDHTIEVTFHKPQDLIISKNVKGSLGDRKKAFEFTVYLTNMEQDTVFGISNTSTGVFTDVYLDGTKLSSKKYRTTTKGEATLKITLKDDQFIRLSDLTGGAKYSVREESSDHVASYKVSGDGTDPVIVSASKSNTGRGPLSTAAETVDESDGLVQIGFSNEKNIVPPTGVRTGNRPLVLAALIASATMLLVLSVQAAFRTRKSNR